MKARLFLLSSLACFLATFGRASEVIAPVPGEWSDDFHIPEYQRLPVEPIRAFASRGDDRFVYGGNFENVAGLAGTRGIAEWNGARWQTMAGGLSAGGEIHTLIYKDAELFAGGTFTNIGGASITNIARWDGTNWHSLGGGIPNGVVKALAVFDGKLVVGGTFTNASATTVQNIAQWDGVEWSAMGAGIARLKPVGLIPVPNSPVPPIVGVLTVHNGLLYAGGLFDRAGGIEATNVANWDGAAWRPLMSDTTNGTTTQVSALLSQPDGGLLAGFDALLSKSRNEPPGLVMEWKDSRWSVVKGEKGGLYRLSLGKVNGLLEFKDWIYAIGRFSEVAGEPNNVGIARWDGENWEPIQSAPLGSPFAMFANDKTLFMSRGHRIATFDGSEWKTTGFGLSWTSEWADLEIYQGNAAIAGQFGNGKLLLWNGNGWRVNSPEGLATFHLIHDLFASGESLYAAGSFSKAEGSAFNRVARFDGTQWVGIGDGIPEHAYSVAARGEEVFVGHAKGISRWDGDTWVHMADGPNGAVTSIAILGEDVFTSGPFGFLGSVQVNGIARWDGSNWLPMGSGMDAAIHSLAVTEDALYAGGEFSSAGGVPAAGIAKWNGSDWESLPEMIETNAVVYSMATTPGGVLYIGCGVQIGDPLKNYVLRWDGTNWSTLDGGVNGNVMAIAADESNVYLGGYFDTAGTNMSVRFAQYKIDTEVNNPEKIDPVVVWDNPSALTYGTPLGSAQLSAQAEVAGEMSYYPPAGTVLPVGNQQPLQVVFTPQDRMLYNVVTQSVSIDVLKGVPVIQWAQPGSIIYGTPLSDVELNATANLPGQFSYSPDFGTILNAGVQQTLTATFQPSDSEHYGSAIRTVSIDVLKVKQVITFELPERIRVGASNALSAVSSSGLSVTFEVVSGPAFITEEWLVATNAGVVSIRARQPGNSNFEAADTVRVSEAVPFTIHISISGEDVHLRVPPIGGFVVETSGSLGDDASWIPLEISPSEIGEIAITTNSGSRAYYRVRML